MLFSSFSDLVALADASDREGTPILRAYEERSENALTRERYERQLGMQLDGISRLLAPAFSFGTPDIPMYTILDERFGATLLWELVSV